MTPMRWFIEHSKAAQAPGMITPKTGTSNLCSNTGSAHAEAVLHATTTAFTFC